MTRHSFSFGPHYDPANVAHGFLVCHDEHLLQPGHGFAEHEHRSLEILTWVLDGVLCHTDTTTGVETRVRPGQVQRLYAGRGVRHSETNGDPRRPLRLVQMWLLPDDPDGEPAYDARDVGGDLRAGGWVTLASGMSSHTDVTAVPLTNSRAALHAARLSAGAAVRLPESPTLHLFVARGGVEYEGLGGLDTGDAVRLSGGGGQRVSAPTSAELLLWEMDPRATTAPPPMPRSL